MTNQNAPLEVDERIATIETIRIEWDTFKKSLKKNYLEPPEYHSDHSHVLRLYPPFESTMDTEAYVSEQGVHYSNDWSVKPVHIKPDMIIREGLERGFRDIPEWPTEANTKHALDEKTIEEDGGIEEAVSLSRSVFWEELKAQLPETVDLNAYNHGPSHYVNIEWVGAEE